MHHIKSLCLLFTLLFIGCTDDDSPQNPVDGTDTETPGTGGGTDSTENPDEDWDSATGPENPDIPALSDLFPHTPGSYWTFRKYGDDGCRPGESVARLMEHQDIDGVTAAIYLAACVDADSGSQFQTEYYVFTEAHVTVIGVTIYDTYTPLDMRYFDTPLMDGHTWSTRIATREITYRWRFDETVTVPAGTFTRCWTREEVGTSISSTFCPSVGRVRWTSDSDDEYDELVDYHIAP